MNSSATISLATTRVSPRKLVDFADAAWQRHPRATSISVAMTVSTFVFLVAGPTAAVAIALYMYAGIRVWQQWQRSKEVAALRHETAAEVSFLAADLQAGADPNKALSSTLTHWPTGAELVRKQLWSAWKVSGRLGAPATDICRALGKHLQAHAMLGERLQAQTASIKATAGLLLVLPGFGILLGESMGASPVHFLFYTWPGFGCVALVLALQGLGWLWVRQLLSSVTGRSQPVDAASGNARKGFDQPNQVTERTSTSNPSTGLRSSVRSSPNNSTSGPELFHVEHTETARASSKTDDQPPRSVRVRNIAISALAGLVALVAFSGWFSFVAAGLLAIGGYFLLVRRSRKRSHPAEPQLIEQWVWCLDLLAAGLKSGVPFPQVASAVARAVSVPLSTRVNRVSQQLMMGAPVTEAVAELGALPGQSRLASQLERSGWSGAAMANGLQELATNLRRKNVLEAEARAGRASVLLVGPLCLCFLPAFVVAGVVPVIFGLASGTVVSP